MNQKNIILNYHQTQMIIRLNLLYYKEKFVEPFGVIKVVQLYLIVVKSILELVRPGELLKEKSDLKLQEVVVQGMV